MLNNKTFLYLWVALLTMIFSDSLYASRVCFLTWRPGNIKITETVSICTFDDISQCSPCPTGGQFLGGGLGLTIGGNGSGMFSNFNIPNGVGFSPNATYQYGGTIPSGSVVQVNNNGT